MSLITGIQKYSIHDGEGIRTTVFFKGCHLNCAWCHNPETKSFKPQLMVDKEKCVSCGNCVVVCQNAANKVINGEIVCDRKRCDACGKCIDSCSLNLREIAGNECSREELLKEIYKDEMFYEESGGGVTLSGGEVMASDTTNLVLLMKKLKRRGINITIDTCGQAKRESFEKVLPYVDTFLYDVKVIDEDKHKKYIGASNKAILSNLEYLNENDADIMIRIPIIKEVNGNEKDVKDIIHYLSKEKIKPGRIHLLPYHNTGSGKYEKLGEEYKGKAFNAPSAKEMDTFLNMFQEAGFTNTQIGG